MFQEVTCNAQKVKKKVCVVEIFAVFALEHIEITCEGKKCF